MLTPVERSEHGVKMIDQRKLPQVEEHLELKNLES